MPQRPRRKAPQGGPQRSCSSRKPFRESKESTRWAPGKPKESHRKTSATLSNAHANQQWYIHISLHNDPACCRPSPHDVDICVNLFLCLHTTIPFQASTFGSRLSSFASGLQPYCLWFRSTFQPLECWMISRLCRTYSGENDGNCPAKSNPAAQRQALEA